MRAQGPGSLQASALVSCQAAHTQSASASFPLVPQAGPAPGAPKHLTSPQASWGERTFLRYQAGLVRNRGRPAAKGASEEDAGRQGEPTV